MVDVDQEGWQTAVRWVEKSIRQLECESAGPEVKTAIESVGEARLGDLLKEWTFTAIDLECLKSVSKDFATRLSREDGEAEVVLKDCMTLAYNAFKPLNQVCMVIDEVLGRSDCSRRFRTMFNNTFLLGNPSSIRRFRYLVHKYLGRMFRRQQKLGQLGGKQSQGNEEEEDDESGEDDSMMEVENVYEFEMFATHISTMHWFLLIEEPLSDILCQEAEKKITKKCRGNYEVHLLGRLCEWLDSVLLNWLRHILYACISTVGDQEVGREEKFDQWKARLEFHVFETLCDLRMTELFDIVTEFPESSPSLLDLKDCLARTHQYKELVLSLRFAFASRLLHPGANTAQILDVYVSTIKALRLLDPSGVLLEAISEPIKSYLRKREDTVRCIVTSLTDDSNSELFEDLGTEGEIRPITQNYDESDDEEEARAEAELNHEDWTPDPIEADPHKTSSSRKSNDILSMLVHIYGSKELFVNEYRLMLADKLLSSLEFDTEREVRNLELLKLRFGEGSMLGCEIMIKDIEDSKRINTNIKNTLKNKGDANRRGIVGSSNDVASLENLEVTIVSKQFWPTLHGEEIVPHPLVKNRMSAIAHEYSVLKNPRQLVWKTNLGLVQLELSFEENQTKSFTVTPLLATLVMHIAEREVWTASDLGTVVGLDHDTLKKRMSYWVNQGVVRQSKDNSGNIVYAGVDRLSDDHKHQYAMHDDEDATERAVSADTQLAEEMQVYESFVRGMLNNYESLPLDRIHNMLKMFVSTGEHKYDKNEQQLGAFLDKLCRDDVLEFTNGAYFLKKSTSK